MRPSILAVALVGALSAGALGISCTDGSGRLGCARGTLLLQVALFDDAPLADTITITADDIGAVLNATFPHTPNPVLAGTQEHIVLIVTWPQGYPADHLVFLHIVATAKGNVVGVDNREIRLLENCTEAAAILSLRSDGPVDDLGPDTFDL